MGWWRVTGRVVLAVLILGTSGWGALALHYGGSPSGPLRAALAVGFGLCGLTAVLGLAFTRWRRRAAAGYAVLFAAVVGWWSTIQPSNDRDWQPEVAALSYATIDGDLVTVHNIRNFDYRSETDFEPRYYDKTFDLRKLNAVDLLASYWMGPAIAHMLVSFDFEGDDHLAISIEARKERGEGYSSINGFFRRYELYYVVADERDVIRLRTNYRKDPPEDVYLYRVRGSTDNARRLFTQYMDKINALNEQPEFYNTLTTNCTTNIWVHAGGNPSRVPFSWKILLSGYVPEYLYEKGRLDTSLPFAEFKRRSRINDRAKVADGAADFSRRIRAGL
ncbi:MAG: DUF4105 domain-containing protein [Gammaproteobacteria bacterium]|nr:DUF4105 domain-containing protein [Gammaproteobacteria bacterium]NIR85742.1 DUF4105 domain-containing protein [Gammaproteobacteria bacterium]NIR90275.1 DUF4105 domain-containing protein [Gammaproteobacteria bacterium]NIU06876.1 DUF4105 domain-containing protein [Gammaproteobacteria bacterium]NIV53809.1 DUF4105 domain-containing protein [Gammaproteobacteria bacterium]